MSVSESKMRYVYINIYRFEGISGNELDEDKVVYQDNSRGITVHLTNNINSHRLNLDIGMAAASLLLRGVFGDKNLEDLPTSIDDEVTKIQEERDSNKKSGVYAVIIIKGDAELKINKKLHKATDQFSICFDAINKESIFKLHKEKVHAIVTSLSMSTSPEYHAEKESSGVYFIDENDKPLYSFKMQAGSARAIVSEAINDEIESEISKMIDLSTNDQQLKTPFRLFTQSLENPQDKLRSFTSAWSALEIFTNKVFSSYEDKFIAEIADDHNSHGVNQFLMRIKDVMKDKYRLMDKFSLIASLLSDEIEADIDLFKKMKSLRDDISHGKEFDEEALPVEDARKLAAKYLKRHMLLTAGD